MEVQSKVNNLLTYFIIPFSGFYITSFTLSPIYFLFVIAVCLYSIYLTFYSLILFNQIIIFSILIFIYTLITQVFIGYDLSSLIGFLFSIAYFIFSILILRKASSLHIIKASKFFIYFSTVLLILESVWRLNHPIFYKPDNYGIIRKVEGFYPYKLTSFMYGDSNFVGLYIVCIFFFTLYLSKYTNQRFRYTLLILFILAFLTFSRAAIISIIIFYLIFKYISLIKKIKLSYIIIGILIFAGALIYTYYWFSQDDSFNTKFYVIEVAIDYLFSSDIFTILFGIGFGNTYNYLQMGAHNILVTYFLESGLIGLFIVIFYWYRISKSTNHEALYVMLPFLLTGFSLTSHAIPYLYCIFAIIYVLEKREACVSKEINC